MKKSVRVLVATVLATFLILIRWFENELFYDPLLVYFRVSHSTESLPEVNDLMLLLNVAFRYWMNTIVSLGILWFIFYERELIRFSFFIYLVFYILLMIPYFLLLQSTEAGPHMALFYVRRFLIQPLLLLILLPAFYFQKRI